MGALLSIAQLPLELFIGTHFHSNVDFSLVQLGYRTHATSAALAWPKGLAPNTT